MANEELKAQLREKILQNVKVIQEVIPDFKLTEDQINYMISDERIALKEKSKQPLSNMDRTAEAKAARVKQFPVELSPNCFKRVVNHVIKLDGTPETEKFNKIMFENLNRDDEMGEICRENFYLHSLNKTLEIDPSKLTADVPELEFLEYAINKIDDGGLVMDTEYMSSNMESLEVNKKSNDKIDELISLGTCYGGGIRYVSDMLRSDDFLTFPYQFFTPEQAKIAEADSRLLSHLQTFNYMRQITNMQNAAKSALGKELEPATMADFHYKKHESKRIYGGLNSRREIITNAIDEIDSMQDDIPGINELKNSLNEYKKLVEGIGDNLSDEQRDTIVSSTESLNRAIFNFKKGVNEKELPQASERVIQLCNLIQSADAKFKVPKELESLVEYQKRDNLNKSIDLYTDMEKSMKKLNDTLNMYRTPDKYGALPKLSAEDFMELKTMMAETMDYAEKFLDSPGDDTRKFIAETTCANLKKNVFNLGCALPGMTLDDAIEGKPMNIDLSGRELAKVGNCLSSRQSMSITGPDGRTIKGFFTEKTTLNTDEAVVGIISKLNDAYPNHKDLSRELAEFYIDRNDKLLKPEKEEKKKEIMSRFPKNLQDEVSKMCDDADGLCDKFKTTKASYSALLQDETESGVENRNVAMSDVAGLLGSDSLIAKSIPIKITNNGREISGCFMENAAGDDMDHIKAGSHFLDIKKDYLDNSPALKQISDMQILDYICGNVDRHPANMFYQFDENNKIIGVVGIDNDMSFMTIPANDMYSPKFARIQDMNFVSRSMAEKVLAMDPETLKYTLSQRKISPEATLAAADRLQELKNAINDSTLSVIDDNEFLNKKLSDLVGPEHSRNYFQQITTYVDNNVFPFQEMFKNEIKNAVEAPKPQNEPLKSFVGVRASLVQEDIAAVDELSATVSGAQRKVIGGSSEYDKMEKLMDSIRNFTKNSDGKHVYSRLEIDLYKQSIGELKKAADDYLERKEKQGKLNVKPTSKTGKRIQAAKEVLSFCKGKTRKLENTLDPENEILEMKNESDRLQMEAFSNDPKMAGELLKNLNNLAEQNNYNPSCIAAIGSQLQTVVAFMQKEEKHAEDLGITADDLKTAKNNIKQGLEANVKTKEIEKNKDVKEKTF